MKTLIIGGAGFVGPYLYTHLTKDKGWECAVPKLPQETFEVPDAEVYDLDILNAEDVEKVLTEYQPEAVVHLAALSSVGLSWKNPSLTIDINVKGSTIVLDAVRKMEKQPRGLMIGSGEEYGAIRPEDNPVDEETLLRPGNLYAATKACQNFISSIYVKAYQMDIVLVRAFNHIGPKQQPTFVVSDFCKQVAEIEAGMHDPEIWVGNLSAARDFTDVRDVVRAYGLLLEKGVAGETYNIGSGHAIVVADILYTILKHAKKDITVNVDENKLRPGDVPVIEANTAKLREATGWEPKYSVEDTILDVLDYWRNQIKG